MLINTWALVTLFHLSVGLLWAAGLGSCWNLPGASCPSPSPAPPPCQLVCLRTGAGREGPWEMGCTVALSASLGFGLCSNCPSSEWWAAGVYCFHTTVSSILPRSGHSFHQLGPAPGADVWQLFLGSRSEFHGGRAPRPGLTKRTRGLARLEPCAAAISSHGPERSVRGLLLPNNCQDWTKDSHQNRTVCLSLFLISFYET